MGNGISILHVNAFVSIFWFLYSIRWNCNSSNHVVCVNKDEYVEMDQHGKRIMNWITCSLIYTLIALSIFLFPISTESFVFISKDVLLLISLVVCSIVFTILDAIRSFKSEIYYYHISINIIK